MSGPIDRGQWRAELEEELRGNILPFWLANAMDLEHGGYIGAMGNDGAVYDAPRTTVLATRILWTFSAAAREFPQEKAYREMADKAFRILLDRYWDEGNQGFPWSINAHGVADDPRKHSYPHAFAVYALSEYCRLTRNEEALTKAIRVYELLEAHGADREHGGYVEGCGPDWGRLEDFRLSDKEPNVPKTMNSHLHLLEAFTNLRRVWDDACLAARHRELLQVVLDRIVDPETGHFILYFQKDWTRIGHDVSYGHDIEGAWLLREAAHLDGTPELSAKTDAVCARMAETVLRVGVQADGSVAYEGDAKQAHILDIHWWPQAEGMVGFMDAFQLTRDARFLDAAHGCWGVILSQLVDREGGDWFKVVRADGSVADTPKIGPWECPYHHARACLEMLERLG